MEKNVFFLALPELWRGGSTHAQIFWPFFYQVIVPKMTICLLKLHSNCMFLVIFVIIIIEITITIIIIIIATINIIIGICLRSYAQNVIFDVRKKRTKLPELGG